MNSIKANNEDEKTYNIDVPQKSLNYTTNVKMTINYKHKGG